MGFFIFLIFITMRVDVDYIISLMKEFTINEKDGELGEQEDAGGGGGAASGGGGGTYPTVTKWSSGRKFGPTYNPEQPKWNGNGIARGKANTLL